MSDLVNTVDVAIIGAGQAGLSVSYYLQKMGILNQIIFEKNEIAHSWKNERWDNFSLVTPNFQCRLPDHDYAGSDPSGFMLKQEIVEYVLKFAEKIKCPIFEGVEVISVEKESDAFIIKATNGRWNCKNVIVATSSFHTPVFPKNVESIPKSILQIQANKYKNSSQMRDGATIIVGSGQSGCQIAEDLMLEGHQVHLFLGNAPRSPRKYRGKDAVAWLEEMGYYKITFAEHPNQKKALTGTNHYLSGRDGGKEIDLRKFAQQGVRLYGYLEKVNQDGFVAKADLKEKLDNADKSYLGIRKRIDDYIKEKGIDVPLESDYEPCWNPASEKTELNFLDNEIANIIWCIGYKPNFDYIHANIFDNRGFPVHERGITRISGLFFIGLPWQNTWGSSRFSGIAEDSKFIADNVVESLNHNPTNDYHLI